MVTLNVGFSQNLSFTHNANHIKDSKGEDEEEGRAEVSREGKGKGDVMETRGGKDDYLLVYF